MSRDPRRNHIVRCRAEILVALKMLYPGIQQSKTVYRVLLVLFPDLQHSDFLRDLAYLVEKGYVERQVYHGESDPATTEWTKRWFKLTAAGVEVADHAVSDPALEV